MADNFSSQADLYSKYRPTYPKAMYDFIFRQLQRKENAWDCGTGSGQVAAELVTHFDTVYASDISIEQLQHAPKKENILYSQQLAEDTDFPADQFDLITVAQAIHWFDFNRFYEEVTRTARKGALLAVIGYGRVQVDEKINPAIKKFYANAFGRYFNESRGFINEEYQTIPFPFEEIETPRFNMPYQWRLNDLEGFFNSWSAVQKIKDEEGFNPVDNIMAKIREEWNTEQKKEAIFPVFLRLGKIKK